MKYLLSVTRVSTYSIEAKSHDDVWDQFVEHDPDSLDDETTGIYIERDTVATT